MVHLLNNPLVTIAIGMLSILLASLFAKGSSVAHKDKEISTGAHVGNLIIAAVFITLVIAVLYFDF